MGKKDKEKDKGLKRFLKNMSSMHYHSPADFHRDPIMMSGCAPAGIAKTDEHRLVYAIADMRDELETLRRCVKALMERQGIDYAEVMKRQQL